MKQTTKDSTWAVVMIGGPIALFILGMLMCIGPAGLKTGVSSWGASAYGSDWLVVQYAQSGCVIASWDLKDEAVQNEGSSDGIYFVAESGAVVHLSGHYSYVQKPDEATKARLLRTGLCPEGLMEDVFYEHMVTLDYNLDNLFDAEVSVCRGGEVRAVVDLKGTTCPTGCAAILDAEGEVVCFVPDVVAMVNPDRKAPELIADLLNSLAANQRNVTWST